MVYIKRCSEKVPKIRRKTSVPEFLLNKVVGLRPATLLKKTPTQGFPVNFENFFESTFFTEHLLGTASTPHTSQ